MHYSIYVSTAHTWWSTAALQDLLARSRAHNASVGITGMLLYKDGNFMQVLEGEQAAVLALQARIAADPRHQGMVVIDSGPLARRDFADWSMAFSDLGAAQAEAPAGYSRFMDTPLTDPRFTENPGQCRQMLQIFRSLG